MEITKEVNCNTCKSNHADPDDEPCKSCIESPCDACHERSKLRNWKPQKDEQVK